VAAAAALLACASCGLPRDEAPRPQPLEEVPYGLSDPSPGTGSASPTAAEARGRVALLGRGERLVFVDRPLPDGDRAQVVSGLLAALAAGATEEERDRGLSSALPTGVGLTVTGLTGSVATVDISGADAAADAERLPLSVAQIVLTATSSGAVDAVHLTRDGARVEAPRPDGELSDAPLTAREYASLLAPASRP